MTGALAASGIRVTVASPPLSTEPQAASASNATSASVATDMSRLTMNRVLRL